MKFHVMTLFPEHIDEGLNSSIIKKAREKNLIELNLVNIRDYSGNKHFQVDDYPYGGGAGMLIKAAPVVDCYEDIKAKNPKISKVYYMSPKGKVLTQEKVVEIAKEEEIVILCGHYEGIDERALELIGAEDLSIGDYVLTGGELAAMVMIDAISRFVPEVLHNGESKETESFDNNLLEYAQYTRPSVYRNMKVPDVLLSGNHKKIEDYRLAKSEEITKSRRPDLYEKYTKEEN